MGKRFNRSAAAIAALLIALTFSGCGAGQTADVNMAVLEAELLAADNTLPEMSRADSGSENAAALFTYLSELDYEKVDAWFFDYASGGTAEEVAVIRLKDAADAEGAVQALEAHRDSREGLFSTYAPEEAKLAGKPEIVASGPYVLYAACKNRQAVRSVFETAVQP